MSNPSLKRESALTRFQDDGGKTYSPDESPSFEGAAVGDVFENLWERKWIIVIGAAIGLFLGWSLVLLQTKEYTVSLVVGPQTEVLTVDTMQNGLLGGAFSVGKLLGTESELTPFFIFLKMTSSAKVAEKVLENDPLIQKIYENQWDDTTNSWQAPKGLVGFIKSGLNLALGRKAWIPPNIDDLQKYLSEKIEFESLDGSDMHKMSMETDDSEFGVLLLTTICQVADDTIKLRTQESGRIYIQYLTDSLQSVSSTEQRDTLIQLLLRYNEKLMLADVTLPSTAIIMDGPVVSARPTSPNIPIVLGLSLILGFGSGCLIALYQKYRQQTTGAPFHDDM